MLLSRRALLGASILVLSCTMGEPVSESLSGGVLRCSSGTKPCGRFCLGMDLPSVGCASESCEPCHVPNASATCKAGACAPAVCVSGWRDCDQEPTNGCEEETASCGCHSIEFATPNSEVMISKHPASPDGGITPDALDFRDGDWTWEAWLKVKGDQPRWLFYSNGEGQENNGFGVGVGSEGFQCGVQMGGNPAPSAGVAVPGRLRPHEWQHYACERSGKTLRLYVDGILRATVAAFDVISSSDATMSRLSSLDSSPVLLGPMRISRVARYDKDFEPRPRWTPDGDAVVLYLVSEGMTNRRLADEAGRDNGGSASGGVVDGQGDTPCEVVR